MKLATKAIHFSYDCDEHNRALMPPIYQNSMFALRETSEQVPYHYSRLSNLTHQILGDTVADLEHGAAGFAFSSDMAGIDAVWCTFPQPGDTLTAVVGIYGGAYDPLVDIYQKWGVNVIFVDSGNLGNLDELLKAHNVKPVWLETSSNPFLRLVGTKTLAERTRAANVLIDIDNTLATSYLQQPLDMGCDFVFHSATRYLRDHSDVLMGIVIAKTKELTQLSHDMMVHTGAITGSMGCWLVLRGIKTLALCMNVHCRNVLEIARRLGIHPTVEKVFHPDLPSYEYYKLVETQMPKSIGDVVMVYPKNDTREAANSVIKNMKLVKITPSLGGVENLVGHCYSQSHGGVPHDVKVEIGIRIGLLCSFVGIEDVDDIRNDISKVLDTAL